MKCEGCEHACGICTNGEYDSTAKVSESAILPGSNAKQTAPCDKDLFLESVWELYQDWCKHEDVVSLPDFEKAFRSVKEHGLPS